MYNEFFFKREKIKNDCRQVEETYLKRLDMMEKLLNKKTDERLEELRQEKENELEKLREQSIRNSLEIKNLNEENIRFKDETERLIKLTEELNDKLKEKSAEYDLIVDKNNYLSSNLLNSTAINSSIMLQNSSKIGSSKTTLLKKRILILNGKTKQNESEIGCLALDGEDETQRVSSSYLTLCEEDGINESDEDEDETAEEDDEEEDETDGEEEEDEEEEEEQETDEESEEVEETMEETEIEETQQKIETTSVLVKPQLVTFSDQNIQTESVKTKSIEVEVRKIL